MSECSKLSDQDKKNYCLGTYSASGTYCDKIKNGELTRRDGEGAGLIIEQMGPSGPVPVTLGQG